MDIQDVTGLSEPLKKLVEVVAQGVGNVTKHYFIKKDADARAYELKVLADAQAYGIRQLASAIHDAQETMDHVEFQDRGLLLRTLSNTTSPKLLSDRASSRKEYQELREQLNVEQITSQAAEELVEEESVSEEPVDADWIARFFDMARNVSTDEMQLLWGKILAGEVKQPRSYSLRTLELLRNLSSQEAQVFVRVAKFAIHVGKNVFMLRIDDRNLKDSFNISLNDFLLLQELGLIAPDILDLTIRTTGKPPTIWLIHGRTAVFVEYADDVDEIRIPIRNFTTIGKELVSLIEDYDDDINYIHELAKKSWREGATVHYGSISENGALEKASLIEIDPNQFTKN